MSFLNRFFGPPDNIRRLVEQVKNSANKPIFTMDPILDELGKIGEPAVQPLCVILKDRRSSYPDRCMAGIALVRIGGPAVAQLQALLSDQNEDVRTVVSSILLTIQKGIQYQGALALLANLKESETVVLSAK
jgi:hypothetical protein